MVSLGLTIEQIERYSRQIMVPDFGGKVQGRLQQAHVPVGGAAGLGRSAALYLAAAGVGTLGLVDGDRVALSNLQRQILHFTPDAGMTKAASAKIKLDQLNPEVEVHIYPVRLEAVNSEVIVADYDFIVDGSDNFSTKFLLNDVAVKKQIAFSHAGVVRMQGPTMTVIPGKSA